MPWSRAKGVKGQLTWPQGPGAAWGKEGGREMGVPTWPVPGQGAAAAWFPPTVILEVMPLGGARRSEST